MNKKIFILLIACILLVSVCGIWAFTSLNVYKFSSYTLDFLSADITPEEFCQTKGWGTDLENGYTLAWVDDEGKLNVILSDAEVEAWKNKRYDLHVLQSVLGDSKDIGVIVNKDLDSVVPYIKYADGCGYEISNDFSQIIESPEDNSFFFPPITLACAFIQFIEGVPSEEIRVEFVSVDEQGNALEKIVWPDDIKK